MTGGEWVGSPLPQVVVIVVVVADGGRGRLVECVTAAADELKLPCAGQDVKGYCCWPLNSLR